CLRCEIKIAILLNRRAEMDHSHNSAVPPFLHYLRFGVPFLLLICIWGISAPCFAATANGTPTLAATPPMGWNDWAHYQCRYTAHTVLANAKALVKTGLATHGYNTVTIDDCWMQKDRDAYGNLQADTQRFPQGIKPVAQAVHAMGL